MRLLQRCCFSFERTGSHQIVRRFYVLPHDSSCEACVALGDRVCGAHRTVFLAIPEREVHSAALGSARRAGFFARFRCATLTRRILFRSQGGSSR